MQVAQAGRPGDPREREQDIFENLSDICLCGERLGWGGIADFSKISQKFASVNEDLRGENLPLVKRKHGPAPRSDREEYAVRYQHIFSVCSQRQRVSK